MLDSMKDPIGIAFVGVGGGVATTIAAGLELLRDGAIGTEGLPLAEFEGTSNLAGYEQLRVAGWDLSADDLATAAAGHQVVSPELLEKVRPGLETICPWPAIGNEAFCRNVTGEHLRRENGHRGVIAKVQADLSDFADKLGGKRIVVINLASTEKVPDLAHPAMADIAAFETALDENDPGISPSMLYAYASITAGFPYGNFTPNVAAEVPALCAIARSRGVPVAGRDGKTGQTFLKTVLAPALRARALHVDGWYSTNILGNRDGQALDDPASLASKLGTKGDVLDSMLGYPVPDHIVQISYYKPRGDAKEAWDNIDLTGFLGETMQLKVNFLCKDSILAAPLVIEIVRCLDLAKRRGEAGPIEALGSFFKAPMSESGTPEHSLFAQQARLIRWLFEPAPAGARTKKMADPV